MCVIHARGVLDAVYVRRAGMRGEGELNSQVDVGTSFWQTRQDGKIIVGCTTIKPRGKSSLVLLFGFNKCPSTGHSAPPRPSSCKLMCNFAGEIAQHWLLENLAQPARNDRQTTTKKRNKERRNDDEHMMKRRYANDQSPKVKFTFGVLLVFLTGTVSALDLSQFGREIRCSLGCVEAAVGSATACQIDGAFVSCVCRHLDVVKAEAAPYISSCALSCSLESELPARCH